VDQALNIQAEASLEMLAPCKVVWEKVINLSERPTLKSWSPVSGAWPAETASARVVMDKGTVDMVRTETVVRMIPDKRLLLKVDAPEFKTLAWLDQRLSETKAGCDLSIGVIVAADAGPETSIDRAAYVAGTTEALVQVLRSYQAKFTGQVPPTGNAAHGAPRKEEH
jgi:hypothetical protein